MQIRPGGFGRYSEESAGRFAFLQGEIRFPGVAIGLFGDNNGDGQTHQGAALGVRGIGAGQLRMMQAGFKLGGVHLHVDALGAVGQQHLAGVFHPRGTALKLQALFEFNLLGLLGIAMKTRAERNAQRMGAIDLKRLAQINSPSVVAGRDSSLEAQVAFAQGGMILEPVVCFIHSDHPAALFEWRQAGDRHGGVFQRAPHTMRRVILFLLF